MTDQWYFAHPATAQSRGEKLRKYLERMTGKSLVNPFTKELGVNPVTDAHRLVVQDLELITQCKGLVAWFPRYTGGSPQVGTSMEVMYARHIVGIPVVIYAHEAISTHPWLVVHGTVCTTIAKVIEVMRSG